MAEILGEGSVIIVPDTTGFAAALQAQIAPALAAVEKQLGGLGGGAAAAGVAGGIGGIGEEATGTAAAISGKLSPALKGIEDSAGKAGKALGGANTSVLGLQRSVLSLSRLAPVLAAVFSVKIFGDWEKASQEASAVFGDSAKQIRDFADGIDKQLGLTTTAALRFAVDFGNALQGIGFSAKTAADAAEQLTTRTADVAAALAKSPQQIATAFNLALEGNTRGLKQLGITISALDIQNRAAQLGFKGTVAQLSDAQRAATLYSLVLDATNKFQGQAAATADTFAGHLRDFKATAGDAATTIGRDLAPAAEALLGFLAGIIEPISKLPSGLLAFAAAAGVTAVALKALAGSALLDFLSGLGPLLGNAVQAVKVLAAEFITLGEAGLSVGAAIEAIGGPVAIISLAVGALAVIFGQTKKQVDDTVYAMGVFDDLINKTGNDLQQAALKDALKAIAKPEITDAIKAAGISVADFANGVTGGADASQALINRLIELHGEGKITDDQFTTLYNSAIDLTAQFGDAKGTSDNFAASMKELGIEASGTNDQLSEQTKIINDLFTVTDQLTKANQSLSDANDAVAAAQKKVNDLQAEGGKQEVADAKASLTQANDSLTAALERQAVAQKTLNDLQTPATEQELSDATDAVTLAQIKLAQAVRARDAAEKALNQTTGVTLNLTGLNLRQLGTALTAARAALAAQRVTTPTDTGGATPQETAIEAEINVRRATEDVQKAQDDLNTLKEKGKVETDKTVAAEHELTLANNAVTVAQDEVNKRQAKLAEIQSGNSQWAKDLASANKDLADALGRQQDAQTTVANLTAKQLDDTNSILGVKRLITEEEKNQIRNQQILFAGNANLRRALVENLLITQAATLQLPFGPGLPGGTTPLTTGALTQSQIDQIFAALTGDPARLMATLKSIGIAVPGFAAGGVIDRPTLAWIGEKFRAESIIPWDQPARVWDIMSKSLPHMPTVVRQRLEPVIPGPEHRISRPTHLNVPYAEIDYDRLGVAVAKALRESGATADVDLHIHPAPGMSEAQLIRRAKRELGRFWEG